MDWILPPLAPSWCSDGPGVNRFRSASRATSCPTRMLPSSKRPTSLSQKAHSLIPVRPAPSRLTQLWHDRCSIPTHGLAASSRPHIFVNHPCTPRVHLAPSTTARHAHPRTQHGRQSPRHRRERIHCAPRRRPTSQGRLRRLRHRANAQKTEHLKKTFASYGDKFEVVVVEDITKVCRPRQTSIEATKLIRNGYHRRMAHLMKL
jgi:hypothetical protein